MALQHGCMWKELHLVVESSTVQRLRKEEERRRNGIVINLWWNDKQQRNYRQNVWNGAQIKRDPNICHLCNIVWFPALICYKCVFLFLIFRHDRAGYEWNKHAWLHADRPARLCAFFKGQNRHFRLWTIFQSLWPAELSNILIMCFWLDTMQNYLITCLLLEPLCLWTLFKPTFLWLVCTSGRRTATTQTNSHKSNQSNAGLLTF